MRFVRALVDIWERAKNEHASPREIGWSIAFGAFAACTPFIGLHMWIAMGLATLARKNRLWAFLGSRICTSPMLGVVVFVEVEGAHRVRTGEYLSMTVDTAVRHAGEVFADWLLGSAVVAPVMGCAAGLAAWILASAWVTRAARASARRRTLRYRPSAPPTPIP